MHKVYEDLQASTDGTNFWDAVNTCLACFGSEAENNANAVQLILAGTLKDDRERYSVFEDTYDILKEGEEFGQDIDDNMQ